MQSGRKITSFSLEITTRCNNDCRHCYINLPVNNKKAQDSELSASQIYKIIDEAVSLGAIWCLITGGEPLLREDFNEIYIYAKKKGLLVSVFTNATLLTEDHIELFKQYPPRDIEVTVYGLSQGIYEAVTRTPGSFKAFKRGLDLLFANGIKVRFKAMALRSNFRELAEISLFCSERTKDFFRFDPFLHLRYDGNSQRNDEIKSERLSSSEIVAVERNNSERSRTLQENCGKFINPKLSSKVCSHLFNCGTGTRSFAVSHDGFFRLCSSLWHPDCLYDLKRGSVAEARRRLVPAVRKMCYGKAEFLKKCHTCPIFNLCFWCPAHSHLETGSLDTPVDYFCNVAHARKEALLAGLGPQ